MEFYEKVNELLSKEKVVPFPEVGLDFLNSPPPDSPKLQDFHTQVVTFIRSLVPTCDEVLFRQHIIEKIQKRVKGMYGDEAIFLPCGSCMNGTFLPNADIDFALYFFPFPCNYIKVMEELKENLVDLAMDGFFPIPSARVPVLKFTTLPGISIDISIDALHGPLSVLPVQNIFRDFPCLLPTQLFFKCVLHKMELDIPYSGGISSYTLQMMILAYIQHAGVPKNITDLIIGFCNFYGNTFNFTLTGICVEDNGHLFSRQIEGKLSPETPHSLYLVDPLNSRNILGHNAFKMRDIKMELGKIHSVIVNARGSEVIQSLNAELAEFKRMREAIKKYLIQENLFH